MTIQDWLGTLFAILITPFPRTYLREARKAPGKFSSAVAWLAFLAAATGVEAQVFGAGEFSPDSLLVYILVVPIGVLLFISSLHLVCRRILGVPEDHYPELLYLTVANAILFLLLVVFLENVPNAQPLSDLALFYPLILTMVEVGALMRLPIWKCVGAVILAAILSGVAGMCICPLIISLIGTVPRMI